MPKILAAVLFLTSVAYTQVKTRTDNVKETLHGVELVDPYRWLEDQNSPETRAWLAAQNEQTHAFLDKLPGRDALRKRATELTKVDSAGMPVERSGRYFYTKRLADQEQPVIYMRQGPAAKDEVLVDSNALSKDSTAIATLYDVTYDGKLIVYGVHHGGEDESVLHFMDADTRNDLAEQLPRARYEGVALTPDRGGAYYGIITADGPRLRYHAMGTDAATDKELFGKGYSKSDGINPNLSPDGRYLLITVWHGAAGDFTELFLQDVGKQGPIAPIINGVHATFNADFAGPDLIVSSNWEAPKSRVFKTSLQNPERKNWREIIPQTSFNIEGFVLSGGKIFITYGENAANRIKIFDGSGKFIQDLKLPAIGSGSVSGRWDGNEAFFSFNSFHIPHEISRYNVASGASELWWRLNVPVQSDKFEVEQVWYPSKDGAKIPMFLVHAKGMKLDGARPVFLTGYGGFNVSNTPYFSNTAVMWAERGGVYALANLRGGGEFGEEWHKAGMLDKKQNVFDDFVGAAEWLVQNKYTNPSKLTISGGSNGGLLVGAALTQRPDLFQAVVCSYPLLDMVRYQKFLVASFWTPEYGSSDDPKQFPFLLAYSPYQHVKAGTKYPAVLLESGDSDTRVAPLHARKMAALLQAATGSGKPVLLLYDTEAGHSGGRSATKSVDDQVNRLSFLLSQVGAL
jgi:prolyl oligopeptidase